MTATDALRTGVFPAMITPFDANGGIDHDQLAAEARRLAAAGVDGLVPVGSTGESATLTHDEHIEVVETVVDAVDDVPVIAGTGSNSTREAIALTQRAKEAGADAALLISPYYNCPEPRGMREHYRAVADSVDLPQIPYNVPGRTGRSMTADTLVDLASHENIIGYKAASGDLDLIGAVAERTESEDFGVISGDDGYTLPIVSVGGTGTISVAANVAPERVGTLVGAALADDLDRARVMHQELGPLVRALFVETNPIPVKEALAQLGRCEPVLRSPLTRLSPEHRETVVAALEELDIGTGPGSEP